MRYDPIPSALFIENRKRFAEQLLPGALCILHSNDVAQTNGDGTRSFIQNSNLFWLTGIDQEETILLFFPDSPVSQRRTVLFIRKTSASLAIWEGNKLTKDEATEISGIAHVYWTISFESVLKRAMVETSMVFLCVDHHPGRTLGPLGKNHRFAQWCRTEYPLHTYHNADPLLGNLRMIKSSLEVALIRRACAITHKGFLEACKQIRPGKYEYEIEAEFARTFINNGSGRFAYEPIIASGARSCILHYTANDQVCGEGMVVLMDVGANYANYNADMTRTIPVNGTFTPRQRAVYQAVLDLFKRASALMKPGTALLDYHTSVESFADQALLELGLMSDEEFDDDALRKSIRSKYFLHRTAHFLGLDVHDTGDPNAILAPGTVLTCEPGIYIKEEGLGIRIENDLLITTTGNEDLMADIPLELDDIEALIS
jgi:Xaa-Pro aminopeptidase